MARNMVERKTATIRGTGQNKNVGFCARTPRLFYCGRTSEQLVGAFRRARPRHLQAKGGRPGLATPIGKKPWIRTRNRFLVCEAPARHGNRVWLRLELRLEGLAERPAGPARTGAGSLGAVFRAPAALLLKERRGAAREITGSNRGRREYTFVLTLLRRRGHVD